MSNFPIYYKSDAYESGTSVSTTIIYKNTKISWSANGVMTLDGNIKEAAFAIMSNYMHYISSPEIIGIKSLLLNKCFLINFKPEFKIYWKGINKPIILMNCLKSLID